MTGFYTDKKGYPKDRNTGELIHRRVAENKVGGHIFSGFVVHHKDGNKSNFRRSNLQVMPRASHSRLHARNRDY